MNAINEKGNGKATMEERINLEDQRQPEESS